MSDEIAPRAVRAIAQWQRRGRAALGRRNSSSSGHR